MGFVFIILLRILFVACMVFIIGYVFGGFSKKPALRTITKVATILVIVLFMMANVLFMRMAFSRGNGPWCHDRGEVRAEAPRP
jgi:energy-coupling factor transporter transmembrane protein EcfT